MKKVIYKFLPNGAPSGLSLNQFQVQHRSTTKWTGSIGQDIYSLHALKQKVLDIYPQYHSIPDFDVIGFIRENYSLDQILRDLIEEFVDGFADLIISLCEGTEYCKQCNANLFDSDWAFWKRCKYIVLDGRLLTGTLGRWFCSELSQKLLQRHIDITVLLLSDFTDVKTPSLLGCACGQNRDAVKQYVFDFGNSAVKRGCANLENNKISIRQLTPVFHENFEILQDTAKTAEYLDNFILSTILQTVSEFQEDGESFFTINMCIANNILETRIANRGSYRSLRLISDDYLQHLARRLSESLSAPVFVNIYNDAEAVGRIFTEFSPDTAIITLGTHMGIAYPPRQGL